MGWKLWTGSLNLTWEGVNEDNNNLMVIRSEKTAADYEAEFNEMFTDHRFGSDIVHNTEYPQMIVAGVPIEVYFSPDDGVDSRLQHLLADAQSSIDFMAMTFTLNDLSNIIIADSKRGVQVRGLMEEENALTDNGSDYNAFRQAGLNVLLDSNPGLMHHKVIIIDRQIVVSGSYNFSSSAEKRNDENLVVILDAYLAAQFENEFEDLYLTAKP